MASASRNVSAPVEDTLRRARISHERGALDDAERGYRDVLKIDPDHAEALHMLGLLHFQGGRMNEADTLLKRSIERMPSALALANHASVLIGLDHRDAALDRLDRALSLNPSHLRSLLLRAGVLADLGRYVEAVTAYDCLLEIAPTFVDGLCRRGAVLRVLGRHMDALVSSDRALSVDGRSFDAHRLRAHVLRDLGRLEEALESYGRALAIVPNNAEALLMQGLTLADLGRLEQALASLSDAIAGQPDFIDALYNSAVMLERLERFEQALARCDRVLSLDAGHAGALGNRGNALYGLGRFADALESYDTSLRVAPDSLEVLCNRARVLTHLRREQEALESCDRAITLRPGYGPAWFIRGRILQRLHRYEEALASHDRVTEIDPSDRLALFQRGNTLRSMMRHDEALAAYDRVLAFDPENIATRFTKAFVYLQTGDFERGWAEYEWRWREAQVGNFKRAFAQPLWLGEESIEGRTILLHAEQGLGDTLQFCRYVKFVKARGARVILEVQAALKSLMEEVEGVDQVVGYGEPLPPFDVHCPLLSLPLVFRTDLASIPSGVPYVRANPGQVAKWQTRLGTRIKPRIGIAWSGNPNHLDDHNRSIPLEHLLLLLSDEVEWVSIQKVVRDEEQPLLETSCIRQFGDVIGDFADTAALVECLDCVVSVDTSVAHLAGALARPLWMLLPYLPDWRWLLDREDNPWYPTARLFRQPHAGDWAGVFQRIRAALPSIAQVHSAALPT
ncbi:tetratricopeptide repeat family protein [Caballeronia mineralivorans PML1(12)]|uniref:Tetratricopeptide repeat family protein n=1 Tax=Caballeronia mineralivorans PML1(12) TaxID=908627 RepID=A0A0J1FY49_9BURK|nr:tetratricopeptide repeat family protein [Caballeronia mineralivorans PML1(12)]